MSVYKREWKDKQGRDRFCWYFHKTIDDVRHRIPIPTARTKAQAERAAIKIGADIHEGKYGKLQKSDNFKTFTEKVYLPYSQATKRSFRDDQLRSKALIRFFGKKRLKDISPFDVESYRIKRKNTPIVSRHKDETKRTTKPRTPAAINREVFLLSAILKLAVEKKLIIENPCSKVAAYPEQNRVRYLKPEEEQKLMKVLIGERAHLRDMVTLAIHTGTRRESELFKLTADKVDFVRDCLNITETKSGEDRQVPLNNTSRALLKRLVEEAKMKGWQYLFTNPKTQTRYTTIKTAWETACRLAKITDLRFHDLRHTFGTRATDAGVPLKDVAKVMGHKSTKTTEKYAHPTDAGMRRAVEAIEKKSAAVTLRSHDFRKEKAG
ncbi:MAG: site-specific integrase [Acidobacteriota bacterium]